MVVETNKIYRYKNGELGNADQVVTNDSLMLSSMLSFILDGVTTTNQVNLVKDLFTSDTATGSNMSYNSGTDLYECDTGAGTDICTLVTTAETITTDIENIIIKGQYTLAATTTLTIEASFDNGSNWTNITEKTISKLTDLGTQLLIRFTFTRTNTSSTDNISGYAAYYG